MARSSERAETAGAVGLGLASIVLHHLEVSLVVRHCKCVSCQPLRTTEAYGVAGAVVGDERLGVLSCRELRALPVAVVVVVVQVRSQVSAAQVEVGHFLARRAAVGLSALLAAAGLVVKEVRLVVGAVIPDWQEVSELAESSVQGQAAALRALL